jgi:enolase
MLKEQKTMELKLLIDNMIKDLKISEVLNSIKEKTIEISIKTEKGIFSAAAPSGSSEGEYEAKTLDNETIIKDFPEMKKNFIGKNEKNVDKIIYKIGIEKMGANLSLVLSVAALRALSKNDVYKFLNKGAHIFPYPLGNVIGGGVHKGYTSIQEFLVLPVKAKNMKEAIKTNQSIWKDVGKFIELRGILLGNNYEGAWMCKLDDIKTLDLLSHIAENYGARIGIDVAAYEIYKKGKYHYKSSHKILSPEKQLEFVLDLIKTYRLFYVEDPFHEDDFKHFSELTEKARCLIVGDDIFATDAKRLEIGMKKKAGNGIIIKPDQVGSVSRTLETIKTAKRAGYKTIVSHRSRDTTDSFIADLAVGTESPIIKCGIHGKERTAKLKRLEEVWNKVKKPEMAKLNL